MKCVKRADKISAYCEAVRLANFTEDEASRIFGRPSDPALAAQTIAARTPNGARDAFLARFEALTSERDAAAV